MILCIETATPVCSVAICDSEKIVSIRESHEKKSHAILLTVLIGEMFKELRIKASDLNAVAVSKGPGSYTGLRIGVSTAKGIAYRSGLPLLGIETTCPMFNGMKLLAQEKGDIAGNTLFCPMIDARRMEVFFCLYNSKGEKVRKTAAEVIDKRSFSDIQENVKIIFAGDGAAKCREILRRGNSVFYDDFMISAKHMVIAANQDLANSKFEDIAYFEPFYLKDFIATIPKRSIVGQ